MENRYSNLAVFIHWLMAIMLTMLIISGIVGDNLESKADRIAVITIHKAVGTTILLLLCLRLFERWYRKPPALPKTISPVMARAAGYTHFMLYSLMAIMPLSGWIGSSAGGYPVFLAGIIRLPDIVNKNPELAEIAFTIHWLAAMFLVLIAFLHAIAGISHHFLDSKGFLRRMTFGRS